MADAARVERTGNSGRAPGSGTISLPPVPQLVMPFVVVLVVVLLLIPLPTVLLDMFMAMNLVFSLAVLLIVLYSKKATDFNSFPTILLIVTVFGLSLNVSSTRLILTQGARFDGRMIRAFSSFVVGSGGSESLVVGAIIFIIIIAVQAIVITKGATRVSEVAARFALDSLPGKQMAIDAEYSANAITEEESRRRKAELQQEADFYGAMDGSSKFISGNVKVGIFITVVNILGGIIVGAAIHGETLGTAVGTYISFTIGDGLLSQFPALLVSTAMGIMVTRSATVGDLGQEVAAQFTRDARVYWICAVVLTGFALLPGFPWYVLLPMAVLVGFYAWRLTVKHRAAVAFKDMMGKTADAAKKSREDTGEQQKVVPLDAISLELGYGLIPLVDKDQGAELLDRLQGVRRTSALDLGLVIPLIRIVDNIGLDSSEYCFKIKGVSVGRGKIRKGYYLCINPGQVKEELPGEKTVDPTFGIPAVWLSEEKRDEAERAGYTVVDGPSLIATHLTEIIKRHAAEILGRQETQAILDDLKTNFPVVVEEATKAVTLGGIQKVLQSLLKEQISIRNIVTILEAIADYAPHSRENFFLTEKARQALGSQLCHQYADDKQILHVLTIDPALEQKIVESRLDTNTGSIMAALDPKLQNAWVKAVTRAVQAVQEHGYQPRILCTEAARYLVKSSLFREMPELVVLSVPEIVQDITVESVGVIRLEQ
ncbi:flagellar biosynthesis protein FlhA [Spirochaetia bacterium]|nr:flagellar biosynthesis protein FlhA [Spirochaetia bacterium]